MQQGRVREIKELEVLTVKVHLPSVILPRNAVTYRACHTEMPKRTFNFAGFFGMFRCTQLPEWIPCTASLSGRASKI